MWHFLASYMYQCRAEMVTWPNSLHMRYSPSLPHSQTLANFICQARNLTCKGILSSLRNQSRLWRTTAKSWMVLLSYTVFPQALVLSISMQTRYSFLTRRSSCRVPRGWMLYGTYTPLTVWRNLHGKKEAMVCAGKCLERQNCQAIGWTSLVTPWTRRNSLPFWPPRLHSSQFSWPPAKAVYIRTSCGLHWGQHPHAKL